MPRQRAPQAQSLASAVMAFLYALAKVLWPMFVVFAAVRLYKNGPESSLTAIQSIIWPVAEHTPTSPHAASWRSWSHPSQFQLGSRPGSLKKDWNILHHLGGNGPWVEMLDEGGKTPDLAPLLGCSIDQVHMV
jgi:acid phosphatase